jgi:N-acetylglucosamine-6-sulfatase
MVAARSIVRGIVTVCAVACLAGCERGSRPAPRPTRPPKRPNYVFILVDDMRWDAMSCAGHPFLRTPNIDRIAEAGVRFANAFVTTSLCSPSRASYLTGTYAHRHGVCVNDRNDPDPTLATFPAVLQQAGYETAYIGKWHMAPFDQPRRGFDYWLSFPGQGVYNDPEFNENGHTVKTTGYVTDILTEYALKFLNRDRSKPFCLILSHKAVHGPSIPADRHKDAFAPELLQEPASYGEDLSDKPRWMRELAARTGRLRKPAPSGGIPAAIKPEPWDTRVRRNERRLNWYRTMLAVDESVGAVLDALAAKRHLSDTVVIFASDNGYFLGEHGNRRGKRLAYEESIRVPLLACGPGVRGRGRVVEEMVLNIDVAPTVVDLAGIPVPETMQGRSLVPLLAGKTVRDWRSSFLYEYFREDFIPAIPTILAVRTDDWKYITCPGVDDIDELYHLTDDPIEMKNLANSPAYAPRLQQMREELEKLKKDVGYRPCP